MNKNPQGIKTSVSGKHFKPSLKLIRMRPRTASNHCKHRQPQTSENHEQNRLKAASNTPERLKIIMLGSRQSTFNQLTPAQSQSTNQETTPSTNKPTSTDQPTKQPTHRPTDRRTGQPASQPISPTCQPQPTSQPVRPTCGARALREQATCRLPKLEPLSAPQNEVHNL